MSMFNSQSMKQRATTCCCQTRRCRLGSSYFFEKPRGLRVSVGLFIHRSCDHIGGVTTCPVSHLAPLLLRRLPHESIFPMHSVYDEDNDTCMMAVEEGGNRERWERCPSCKSSRSTLAVCSMIPDAKGHGFAALSDYQRRFTVSCRLTDEQSDRSTRVFTRTPEQEIGS